MPGELVKLLPLKSAPGIKRDGTIIEGANWTDGQWSRFYRGLPRSMPGYKSISEDYHGPSRGLMLDVRAGFLNIFSGYSNGIEVGQFNRSAAGSTPVDRTPAGFTSDSSNLWQMDTMFTTTGSGFSAILAHAAPNLTFIDSSVERPVYYGDITTTAPLINTTMSVSGGVAHLNPFAVAYGNDGEVNVSAAADPTTWPLTTQFNICADKIVRILPIRGGAYSPSGLIWSLSSLLRMSFVGGATVWQFDTLADTTSVLSSNGMVEHDGIYYWPGIDRFLMYNGVVREVPNTLNSDFFYTNLNYAYQQKVFGFKVPRWGEIWWCAPLFGATECNWVIIYNYRENIWYDTPLPSDGRSAAISPSTTFPYSIMSSAGGLPSLSNVGSTSYPLWQHEAGLNIVRGNQFLSLESSITSNSLSIVGGALVLGGSGVPGDNVYTQVVRFEPDFLDNPDLTVNLLTRQFPQDVDTVIPVDLVNDIEDIDRQARYIRWQIVSNKQNTRYVLGQSLIHYRQGDRQP